MRRRLKPLPGEFTLWTILWGAFCLLWVAYLLNALGALHP